MNVTATFKFEKSEFDKLMKFASNDIPETVREAIADDLQWAPHVFEFSVQDGELVITTNADRYEAGSEGYALWLKLVELLDLESFGYYFENEIPCLFDKVEVTNHRDGTVSLTATGEYSV